MNVAQNGHQDKTMIHTSKRYKFEHFSLHRDGDTWRWRHHYADGRDDRTSRQAYADRLSAAKAAAVVAHCHAVPVVLPRELRAQLVQAWRLEGAHIRRWSDSPALMWNRYQREGYHRTEARERVAA